MEGENILDKGLAILTLTIQILSVCDRFRKFNIYVKKKSPKNE